MICVDFFSLYHIFSTILIFDRKVPHLVLILAMRNHGEILRNWFVIFLLDNVADRFRTYRIVKNTLLLNFYRFVFFAPFIKKHWFTGFNFLAVLVNRNIRGGWGCKELLPANWKRVIFQLLHSRKEKRLGCDDIVHRKYLDLWGLSPGIY